VEVAKGMGVESEGMASIPCDVQEVRSKKKKERRKKSEKGARRM
jgi:hypothetical protein